VGGLLSMWRQHTVTIEPYRGTNSQGQAVYGPPVAVEGFLEEGVKLIRKKDAAEVTSTSQFRCALGTDCPPKSRATLPGGDVTTALAVSHKDGGRLPLPSHLEIAFE
jgi:hypothetical protein